MNEEVIDNLSSTIEFLETMINGKHSELHDKVYDLDCFVFFG